MCDVLPKCWNQLPSVLTLWYGMGVIKQVFFLYLMFLGSPESFGSLVSTHFQSFGSNKANKAIWEYAQFFVTSCIWLDRSPKIFRIQVQFIILMWHRILFVVSVWLKANDYFRRLSLSDLHRNSAAVLYPFFFFFNF